MHKMTKKSMLFIGVGGNAIRQVLNIQKMNEAFEIALFDSDHFAIERLNKT